MRTVFHVLLLCLWMPLMVSCDSRDEYVLHGYLYFAKGPYLMRFSLRDGDLEVVTNLGNKTIREITQFGEGRLLISELASINRKEVARISWLDLKTGQSEALYSGVRARYLDSVRVIVYDDGEKLYSVYLAGDSEIDSIIMAHKRNRMSAMIEVSNGSLLFEVDGEEQPVIFTYQPVTGDLGTLDQLAGLCRLEGAVWIDDLEQLACRQRGGTGDEEAGAYILADLDGSRVKRLALPGEEKFTCLTYIESQGVLIFSENWRSKFGGQANAAVWAHDVLSGENFRLPGAQNLGSSVVYVDY